MGIDYDIRLARAEEECAVRRCAEGAFMPYVAAIGQKPAPMTADFHALIAAGCLYVAVQDDTDILGFIVFYRQGASIQLENIAVRPDMAGRGIGKRLIGFCEAEAKRQRAVSVTLYTNAKMTDNLSIYPHLGYQETDRRRENGFDRVFFEKCL
ncbi:MAG: GNAT family N-acetyltransferase [Rhodobacterales bacterium]|nr:MAG: GNAT family N-acetyltransferase [Rhodobacterales bacterium]